jgi:hypothetical protein
VTPPAPSVAAGIAQPFTATGTYTDASTQDLTALVTWASTNLAVATVDAGGLATTLSAGSTTISATLGAISASTLLAVQLDTDGDLVADSNDNCRYTANPTQADVGGVDQGGPDGIGDACQCGDINDDGVISASDVTVLRRALSGLSPYNSIGGPGNGQAAPGLPDLDKCNVGAAGAPLATCTAADATVISRAISGLSPGIGQTCAAALP